MPRFQSVIFRSFKIECLIQRQTDRQIDRYTYRQTDMDGRMDEGWMGREIGR